VGYSQHRMASPKSQFDFRRYGKYMVVVGLLFGVFLSRQFGACLKHYWDAYDISAGVRDAKDSTGLVDDTGAVKKGTEGDYQSEVLRGASFPSYVVEVCKLCAREKSFSEPIWAFFAFWGLLGFGIVFMIVDRFVSSGWRDDVRKRNEEVASMKRGREEVDLAVRRAQTTSSIRKVKAIEVEGLDDGPDLSNGGMVMSNSGDLPVIPRPSPRTSLSLDDEDDEDFGRAEFSIERNDADDSSDEGIDTGSSSPKIPARDDLAALGLGTMDGGGWLSGNEADMDGGGGFSIDNGSSDSYDSLPTGIHGPLDTGIDSADDDFPSFDGADSALSGLGAAGSGPSMGDGDPLSLGLSEERSFDADPPSVEEATPSVDLGRAGGAGAASSGVRLSQRRLAQKNPRPLAQPPSARPSRPVSTVGASSTIRQRFTAWVPKGRENDRVIYACPEEDGTPTGGDSPERPIGGIRKAIKTAAKLIQEGGGAHVRLLPGLYRETVRIPAGIAVVNDGIPRGLERDELRFWLLGSDEDADRSHHVVIAPPTEGGQVATVTIDKADNAVLAGVHVVSRAEVDGTDDAGPSRGIEITDSSGVSLYLVHVAGHRTKEHGAGIFAQRAGDSPDKRLLIQDCLIEANRTQGRGGGLYLEDTVAVIRGSAVQANESAVNGGGICAVGSEERQILLEDSLVTDNVVHVPSGLPRASRTGWAGQVGHGGGLFIESGSVHLKGSDVLENLAQGAGGGIFATRARILIEGNPDAVELTGRIAGNTALRGGGVLLSGGKVGEPVTALRAQNAEFIGNEAKESGGAIAAFRLAYVELHDTLVKQNNASAEYGEGGGIHVTLGCRVKLFTTDVSENQAQFRGGGLSACNSSLRVFDGCEVRGNRCRDGDTGGVAFYTMESSYLEDVRESAEFEDPVVFALGEVSVAENHAARGVGGVFVGNYVKDATQAIAFATRAPGRIANNTVNDPNGKPAKSGDLGPKKPVDLLVLWKRVARGNENKPPVGKKVLR
jgi:predicted outer membrane repeat protein